MDRLERIVLGMKDLESRFFELGRIKRRFRNILPEEYVTYKVLIRSYLKDLEIYPDIYEKIHKGIRYVADMLSKRPKTQKEHKGIMTEYISTLRNINSILFDYMPLPSV